MSPMQSIWLSEATENLQAADALIARSDDDDEDEDEDDDEREDDEDEEDEDGDDGYSE